MANHNKVLEDGLSTRDNLVLLWRTRLQDVPEVALRLVRRRQLVLDAGDVGGARGAVGRLAALGRAAAGRDVLVEHDAAEDFVGGFGLVPRD